MTDTGGSKDGDQFWFVAGISDLKEKDGSQRVRIPDRLFRDNSIIVLNEKIDWHFNTVTGVLVIVTKKYEFDSEDYKYTSKSTEFNEGEDSDYRTTVPKPCFKNESDSRPEVPPELTEKVQLPKDEYLFFVYNRDMVESEPKSCYVLTEDQFDKRFKDSDHWDGSLDEAPKFFS